VVSEQLASPTSARGERALVEGVTKLVVFALHQTTPQPGRNCPRPPPADLPGDWPARTSASCWFRSWPTGSTTAHPRRRSSPRRGNTTKRIARENPREIYAAAAQTPAGHSDASEVGTAKTCVPFKVWSPSRTGEIREEVASKPAGDGRREGPRLAVRCG